MRYATTTKSSWRASRLRDSTFTAPADPTREYSQYWRPGRIAALLYVSLKIILISDFSFELNLSATESALTLISHYRPFPSHDPKALRVRLIQILCTFWMIFIESNACRVVEL